MMELVRSHRIQLLYEKLYSFVSRLFDHDGYNQIRERKTRQGGGYHLRRVKVKTIVMAKRRWHRRDEVSKILWTNWEKRRNMYWQRIILRTEESYMIFIHLKKLQAIIITSKI